MISLLVALATLTGTVVSVDSAVSRIPSLAVMPLQGKSLQPEEAEVLCEAFTSKLKSLGHAHVIERTQIDKILAEQGFQKSGACDKSECAVEVGRIAGIDQMVVGSVGKLGNTWSMVVRLVNVQTGEILSSAQDTREGQVDVLLRESVPTLASQLLGLGPKAAAPVETAPAAVGLERTRNRKLEGELISIINARGYLEKKGLARARALSDSVDFPVRHAMYEAGSVSGWWALANLYYIPIGSIVQKDWTGVGISAAIWTSAVVVGARSKTVDGLGTAVLIGVGAYVFGIVRPIWFASNNNDALRNGLQIIGYSGPDGTGTGAKLAYGF